MRKKKSPSIPKPTSKQITVTQGKWEITMIKSGNTWTWVLWEVFRIFTSVSKQRRAEKKVTGRNDRLTLIQINRIATWLDE